ncbi:MAG: hypothetical protein ACTS3F_04445 [Phycisphaerales bacterium]
MNEPSADMASGAGGEMGLPWAGMLLAGGLGCGGVAAAASLMGVVSGRVDIPSAWWGFAAAWGGLLVGLVVMGPWRRGTVQSLSVRVFAGQGVSMFAVLVCGGVVWFMVGPEPVVAGLVASAGFMAGLMGQILVFARRVRSAEGG